MPSSEAFEALKAYLIENFNAKPASGGKEVIKRCHFCGDSRDPTSRHLYIGQKPNGSIVYNCFKCPARGIVDAKFLRDMGCYDSNIMLLCEEQNKKAGVSGDSKSGRLVSARVARHLIIDAKPSPYTEKKLAYISNRMGCVFNYRDAAMFKIVLSLKDFLTANGIIEYTRYPDIVDQLDKFFLGFLSMDNRYVILRRLVPEGKVSKYIDFRFVNYGIFTTKDDSMKYYMVPSIVNPSYPVDIHIAEGAFDILSIYLHVAPIGGNAVYAAICGNSYVSLVKFLVSNYGFMAFNLHLYPDKDIGNKEMEVIAALIEPYNAHVFIHRNSVEGEKDFGVSMDKIQDSCKQLY